MIYTAYFNDINININSFVLITYQLYTCETTLYKIDTTKPAIF